MGKRVLWICDEKIQCRPFPLSDDAWKEELYGYHQFIQNVQEHLNLQRHFQEVIREQDILCFIYHTGDPQPTPFVPTNHDVDESVIQVKRLPAIDQHYRYRVIEKTLRLIVFSTTLNLIKVLFQ